MKCKMFIPYYKLILFFVFLRVISFCRCNSPQNIETFYPYSPPHPPKTPTHHPPPPPRPPPLPPAPPSQPSEPSRTPSSSSNKAVFTAVGVTAASTLVLAAAVFFVITKYNTHRRQNDGGNAMAGATSGTGGGGGCRKLQQAISRTEFARLDGNVKGLIVDEDGLDVLYWRKLEGSGNSNQHSRKLSPFHKEAFSNKLSSAKRASSKGSKASSSHAQNTQDDQTIKLLENSKPSIPTITSVNDDKLEIQPIPSPPLPPPSPPIAPPSMAKKGPPPPPSHPIAPPSMAKKGPPPPSPPIAPPVPQSMAKKGPPPPPPPIKNGGSGSGLSSKPPMAPTGTPSSSNIVGEDGVVVKNDQVKMKPLHWEKVNVNRDHSMVWDKLDRGSFQYNGDMMEALFGSVAANRKSQSESTSKAKNNKPNSNPSAKIFLLEPKRSQNIAIVIQSLNMSFEQLVIGLQETSLELDTLEKLTRIAPNKEEKTKIIAYQEDVSSLSDAECFLYRILKVLPFAFERVNIMLFRLSYEPEIQLLKDSLFTLDTACTELRNSRIFTKLLEAILKAGNRLNAGTNRGDAKAFNLSALLKLSDYKSSDGKITLLHFVVHEVVRNEGRRCVMNRNTSLTRSNSQRSSSSKNSNLEDEQKSKEQQEREFLKLGLPVVGGLSSEFSNVKKAALIDYDTISSISNSLTTRIVDIQGLLRGESQGEEFVKDMEEFLTAAKGEVDAVKREETRVMEFVIRTTKYYQGGGFKDKQPFQLFVIVKDFLRIVDQACIDIARSLQQQRKASAAGTAGGSSVSGSSSSSTPDVLRTRVTFPRLPDHFLTDKTTASDSDGDRKQRES